MKLPRLLSGQDCSILFAASNDPLVTVANGRSMSLLVDCGACADPDLSCLPDPARQPLTSPRSLWTRPPCVSPIWCVPKHATFHEGRAADTLSDHHGLRGHVGKARARCTAPCIDPTAPSARALVAQMCPVAACKIPGPQSDQPRHQANCTLQRVCCVMLARTLPRCLDWARTQHRVRTVLRILPPKPCQTPCAALLCWTPRGMSERVLCLAPAFGDWCLALRREGGCEQPWPRKRRAHSRWRPVCANSLFGAVGLRVVRSCSPGCATCVPFCACVAYRAPVLHYTGPLARTSTCWLFSGHRPRIVPGVAPEGPDGDAVRAERQVHRLRAMGTAVTM